LRCAQNRFCLAKESQEEEEGEGEEEEEQDLKEGRGHWRRREGCDLGRRGFTAETRHGEQSRSHNTESCPEGVTGAKHAGFVGQRLLRCYRVESRAATRNRI
jgi:hypothetical protein